MTYIYTCVMGVVQGLGEFLPISSTAHLDLISWFWGKGSLHDELVYNVMLHMGTLLALLLYFAKDWTNIIKSGLASPKSENGKLLWLLALGTLPAAIAGKLLEDTIEKNFSHPLWIAFNLALFALILLAADRKGKRTESISSLNYLHAILIGLAQAVAIFPGVSRSGATLTAALFLGYTRQESARISFLLSAPIVLGAVVLKARHLSPSMMSGPFWLGLAAAAITGWLCIKFLLNYLGKHNLVPFVVYRIALALLIAGVFFFK